jgi:hypothetical protein
MADSPTYAEILQELEDSQAASIPGQKSMDKLTLHYLANVSWANQLRECYDFVEQQIIDIDVLRASGSKLDAIVSHVLPDGRLSGDYAVGYVTFIAQYPATSAIVIPAGTQVYALTEDSAKIYFVTTAAGSIAIGQTETTIVARAAVRGITGNIGPYAIMSLTSAVNSIMEVENRLEFAGGTPDETDDELRTRYFDKIQAPGKATALMLQRALTELTSIKEARIWSYGQGDIGVMVDYGNVAAVNEDITDCLEENIAVGTQARGVIGGTIDGPLSQVLTDDVYGGQIWIRTRSFVAAEETLSMTYLDMGEVVQTAAITIPAGTARGVMLPATMATEASRAKKMVTVPTSPGGNSYDVCLGMGKAGLLYNLPELTPMAITARFRMTDTPEDDLIENITASLTAFLDAFRIGERLEYSDVLKFFFNEFDPDEDDYVGRAFVGIDELISLAVSGGGQAAGALGERITVEEDWRLEPDEEGMDIQAVE